jgi:hypothetical protein
MRHNHPRTPKPFDIGIGIVLAVVIFVVVAAALSYLDRHTQGRGRPLKATCTAALKVRASGGRCGDTFSSSRCDENTATRRFVVLAIATS